MKYLPEVFGVIIHGVKKVPSHPGITPQLATLLGTSVASRADGRNSALSSASKTLLKEEKP